MIDSPTNLPIRLVLVDDHPVVLDGLQTMFSNFDFLKVVAACVSGEDALSFVEKNHVDVALVDLRMKPMGGITLVKNLLRLSPRTRAIILSSYDLEEEVFQAIQAGATGYLSKDLNAHALVQSVADCCRGQTVMSNYLRDRLKERKARRSLTPREHEVLEMVAKGLTNKEVAGVLGVSAITVRNQVASIASKLQVSDRTEAARVAIEQGIVLL